MNIKLSGFTSIAEMDLDFTDVSILIGQKWRWKIEFSQVF